MPNYLFRRDFLQPNDAKQRSLVDNLARAMKEVQRATAHVTYDLSQAHSGIDGRGERIEMHVEHPEDPGWHLAEADTLAKYGIIVTRFEA